MRLCHPPDGSTSPKYKLLCFITTKNFFCKEKNTLAFNRDRCCHLVLCLRLIPFHCLHFFKARCSIWQWLIKNILWRWHQFNNLLGDESGNRAVSLHQILVELVANFGFFCSGHANPPLGDDPLQSGQGEHRDIMVLRSGQKAETLSPREILS